VIRRTTLFFTMLFACITVFTVISLIMGMIFANNEADNVNEIVSQQEEKSGQTYWTEERMQDAEPAPMPPDSNTYLFKAWILNFLPVFIILFILLTFAFTFMNVRKITHLEQQNKEILNRLK